MTPATKNIANNTKRLLIQIRLPDGHWAGDLTRQAPHITLSIEEHMPLSSGRGTAKAILLGPEIEVCNSVLENHLGIEEFITFKKTESLMELNVTIAKRGGGFLKELSKATVVPRTPFEVRDGWVQWEFVTDHSHARSLVNSLKESNTPHRVISFGTDSSERLLTPRQREVFDLAVIEGYYEIPRRTNLTKLAGILGVSKSTICELVQHIEKQIIGEYRDDVRRSSPLE
jgi:hypothetical protein